MKPAVCVDKMESVRMPEERESKDVKTESRRCCFVSMVTASIVFLMVISSVTAFFVYNLNKEHIKEYQLTVHYENGLQNTERVVVTDKEEVFETNDVYFIYDFSTGLNVMFFKNQPDFKDCYVNSFNMSEIPTPEEIKNIYTDTKIDTNAGDHILEENFDVTDIWLNTEALGPRSREICQGKNVYFVKQLSDDVTRFKRQKGNKKEVKVEVSLFWGLIKIKTSVKKSKKN